VRFWKLKLFAIKNIEVETIFREVETMEDKNLKLENAVRDMLDGVKPAEVSVKYGINEGTLSTLKKGATIAQKLKLGNEVSSTDNTGLETFSCDNCGKLETFKNENLKLLAEVETLNSALTEASESIRISPDCQTCETKKELAQALLQVSDLRAEIEELKAFPGTAETVIEKIEYIEKEKDCHGCEKMAEIEQDRASMQAEIDRLASHKENLMAKCDRLAQELAEARAAQEGNIKKEDMERLQSLLSSHKTEIETIKDRAKIEIENAKVDAHNKKWTRLTIATCISMIIGSAATIIGAMFLKSLLY
jgi:ElaB/YqjD/DUF883 family membrane-anchored ribosome-binding protein